MNSSGDGEPTDNVESAHSASCSASSIESVSAATAGSKKVDGEMTVEHIDVAKRMRIDDESSLLPLKTYDSVLITEHLLSFQKGDDKICNWKAIDAIVKKLKDRNDEMNALITAVTTAGHIPTKCVKIRRTIDGRMHVNCRKFYPHNLYARLWRWPDLHGNIKSLKALPICQNAYESLSDYVCINPYHYERIDVTSDDAAGKFHSVNDTAALVQESCKATATVLQSGEQSLEQSETGLEASNGSQISPACELDFGGGGTSSNHPSTSNDGDFIPILSSVDFLGNSSCRVSLISTLPKCFTYEKINECIFRANLRKEEDIERFMKIYSEETSTNWNVSKKQSSRFYAKNLYTCHHGTRSRKKLKKGPGTKFCNCEAMIEIRIDFSATVTAKTMDRCSNEEMPATITFVGEHNHETMSAFSLHSLRASEETIAEYRKYYDEGLSALDAVNVHEFKLILENEENEMILANAAFNLKLKTARRKFAAWDDKSPLKLITNPNICKRRPAQTVKERLMDQLLHQKRHSRDNLEALVERLHMYKRAGIHVSYSANPFLVLIVTPSMQKASRMQTAKLFANVCVFTPTPDEGYTVIFMTTGSHFGAVPTVAIILKGRKSVNYVFAFSLLRCAIPNHFGGGDGPKCFLTDEDDELRKALRSVWPSSKLLYCEHRISLRVWQYITAEQDIKKEDRIMLHQSFWNILQAPTHAETMEAFDMATGRMEGGGGEGGETISNNMKQIPGWHALLLQMWSAREGWAYAYRSPELRNLNANVRGEIPLRLFHDILMTCNVANSALLLAEFICCSLEQYYMRHLKNFAKGRLLQPYAFLKMSKLQTNSYFSREGIVPITRNTYRMKIFHEVPVDIDMAAGFCSCTAGQQGALCRHQAFVLVNFPEAFPNQASVSPEAVREYEQIFQYTNGTVSVLPVVMKPKVEIVEVE